MKKLGLILGLASISFACSAFADDGFIAKSLDENDKSYVKAHEVVVTDSDGKPISGVLFEAVSEDKNQFLSVKCEKVGLKLKDSEQVYVVNFTSNDLSQCQFHHEKPATTDKMNQEEMTTGGKFVPASDDTNVTAAPADESTDTPK